MPLTPEWHRMTDTGTAWIARRHYLEYATAGPRLETTLGSNCARKVKRDGMGEAPNEGDDEKWGERVAAYAKRFLCAV
jgi:hypothetical protein